MRPKKVILYVSANEQDRSTMKYRLWANRYNVLLASTEEESISAFLGGLSDRPVDLVMVDYQVETTSGTSIIAKLKEIAPHVTMVLLADLKTIDGPIPDADGVWDKTRMPTSELLDRIKVMCARKRGPRKGSHRMVTA